MSPTALQIRVAKAKDLPEIIECARAAYTKYRSRMDKEPAPMNADFATQIEKGQIFVAKNGAKLLGYVVFYPERPDRLHLENIAVWPELSGQGTGRLLVEYAEQSAREKGCKAVELYTNEVMSENLNWYPKLGYQEIGRAEQDGFKRVFFRKVL